MSAHFLHVPEGEDPEVDLQHPAECFTGYGAHGPQMSCAVQHELDNIGFADLFDREGNLVPGMWLIDAEYARDRYTGEVDGGWVILKQVKVVQRLEEVP